MDLARSLPSDKRRYNRQAKDAERLGPNGTGAGTGSCFYPVMDTPRYRRIESTSPEPVNLVERGKPVSLLLQRR
jgi:hypothetical protein